MVIGAAAGEPKDCMKIYMLKDVVNVGMTGSITKVAEGYARNYLLPRNLAIEVTENDEAFFANKKQNDIAHAAAVKTKAGMIAERVKKISITLKKRAHNDGKLYGAVSAEEIIEGLAKHEITVSKRQVLLDKKALRTTGEHVVTIKLSSQLQPDLTVVIVGEE